MGGLPIPWILKMAISVVLDIFDMLITPFDFMCLGDLFDIIMAFFGWVLWGPIGLINAWELIGFGPTAMLDLVPTMTLVGLTQRGAQ